MAYAYLENVKKMLGISGKFQDDTLEEYIEEVIDFIVDAGVSRKYAEGASCKGLVARGVADLWNLGSGNVSLSPYFKHRVIQLAYKAPSSGEDTPEEGNEVIPITKEEIDEVIEE